MPGEHSDNQENYPQVAEAIGQLHTLTIHYRPGDGLTRPTYNQAYCWSWAQQSAKRIKAEAEAKKRLAWVRHELDHLELPDNLPKGVCHGDTNPTNFLYHQGKLSGVLDFDQASYTWLLYDIAQMMYWLTWPNKGDLNFDTSRKLIAQYEKQRRMTKHERAHLFDALKLVILIGISWFLEDDEGYANARRKVELLNKLGRERFLNYLFDTKAEHSINEPFNHETLPPEI